MLNAGEPKTDGKRSWRKCNPWPATASEKSVLFCVESRPVFDGAEMEGRGSCLLCA